LMSIRRRYHLRKASVKQLSAELLKRFSETAPRIPEGAVELAELEDGREVILVNGKPFLLKTSDGLFPTLASLDRIPLKRVTVDMGAVPYVAGGADVMAPGVVAVDEGIMSGDGVVVIDERHGKPLAIGLALVVGTAMKAPRGRVVKNLHHVGDVVWQLGQTGKG
jgi:PUA-domain protein